MFSNDMSDPRLSEPPQAVGLGRNADEVCFESSVFKPVLSTYPTYLFL